MTILHSDSTGEECSDRVEDANDTQGDEQDYRPVMIPRSSGLFSQNAHPRSWLETKMDDSNHVTRCFVALVWIIEKHHVEYL